MPPHRNGQLTSLCVFCGSSPGADPTHREAAARLGRILAEQRVTLVYGGGHLGMMGALAEAALGAGGRVIGIIPEHLMRTEAAFLDISELIVVDSMHTRKRRMFEAADAFCVLPGGMGTLDETFEILTWKQLRLHDKPIVLANLGHYWDAWSALVETVVAGGFARPEVRGLFNVVDTVEEVLPACRHDLTAVGTSDSRLF